MKQCRLMVFTILFSLVFIGLSKSMELPENCIRNHTFGNKIHYVVGQTIGSKNSQQDAFWIHTTTPFFCVCDGHGTSNYAARFVAKNLFEFINQDETSETDLKTAFENGFQTTNNVLKNTQNAQDCGTTALAVFIVRDQFIVGNVGDCRAIGFDTRGHKIRLSTDHKPNDPDEKKRIEECGGIIARAQVPTIWTYLFCCFDELFFEESGPYRVNRNLAVSRAFGHFGNPLLARCVKPIPEVLEYDLTNMQYLVIASDGLWCMIDYEIITYKDIFNIITQAENLESACQKVINLAKDGGSTDNITVIIVDVREYVKALGHLD
jgi:protein phosphatase 1L